MSKRKMSIRLNADERATLVDLYLRKEIPIDQYDERRDELVSLRDAWARITGRDNAASDILHYMRNQRKAGKWVTLGSNAVKREPHISLSVDEQEILIAIYRDNFASIETGTDSISCNDEIMDMISKEFACDAGRVIPGGDLAAALTAFRKRGLLPKVEKLRNREDIVGFDDIDMVG